MIRKFHAGTILSLNVIFMIQPSYKQNNIALFSKLQGLNPQYDLTGGTNWSYTPTRTYSIGVDINF